MRFLYIACMTDNELHNMDIEDLMKCSQHLKGCPYYASRGSIPYVEFILLPYNLIINKPSREALGIDLHVIHLI